MIVVDASVVAAALADDDVDGDRARSRLRGERLVAPEILDLEVASVVRSGVLTGTLDEKRAALALDDLAALDLRRAGHLRLLPGIWEHRHNLSAYDAAYVALAEVLGAPFVTADARVVRAPGIRCEVEHLA